MKQFDSILQSPFQQNANNFACCLYHIKDSSVVFCSEWVLFGKVVSFPTTLSIFAANSFIAAT